MRTWLSPRALLLHLVMLAVVPGFLALAWWQLNRALGGNGLSWAYTFEWPFFAGYAVFIWWKLVHDDRDRSAGLSAAVAATPRPAGWALQKRAGHDAAAHSDATTTRGGLGAGGPGPGNDGAEQFARPGERLGAGRLGPVRRRPRRLTVAEMATLALADISSAGHGPSGDGEGVPAPPASDHASAAGVVATVGVPRTESAADTSGAAALTGIGPGSVGDPPGTLSAEPPPSPVMAETSSDSAMSHEDRELAEYNEYLAALHASGRRKRW